MRINSFLKMSEANGPGKRAVVWFQGCKRYCPGCFNPAIRSFEGGRDLTPESFLNELDIKNIVGLSISGGEPFEQDEELAELLVLAKKKGLNTLVFSGYTYEELCSKNMKALKYCDYLIDGPYEKEVPSKCPWTGSGNQSFLKLENGVIKEDLTVEEEYSRTAEIIIDKEGNLIITGYLEE